MSLTLKEKIIESLSTEAITLKNSVDQFLSENSFDLKLLAKNIGLANLQNQEKLKQAFHSLQKQIPCFIDLGIIDSNGNHLNYIGPYNLLEKNYKNTDWFNAAISRDIYISDMFLGYRDIPHFIIAVKEKSQEGTWFLRATIDTYYFNGMLTKITGKSKAEAYIVNHKGIYQTYYNEKNVLMTQSQFKDIERFEGVKFQEKAKYLIMTVWLEKIDWLCIVQIDREHAFKDLHQFLHIGIWIFVSGLILIVMTAFLTTNHLVSRLEFKRRSIRFLDLKLRQANRIVLLMDIAFGYFREFKDTLMNIDSSAVCIHDLVQKGNLENILENIENIRSEVSDSRHSIEAFLKFIKTSDPIIKDLNLNEVLNDLIGFLNNELQSKNIKVIRNYDDSIPNIRNDLSQLYHVFLNLILNAVSEIQHDGFITLTTQKTSNTVVIEISDTGQGISEKHIKTIFEPLFTTKPGSIGLGLSICAEIIEKIGGRISAHNCCGGGACFVVELPIKFLHPITINNI
ncbi:MAG: hypothetical protein HQK79_13555 [Desulfobacterales bacterium]|nr:hypothetical protein [Desulfobacterales bacterium]MBF0397377.1 hypothetical protein [Desulfobacterales bacterium]